MTAAADLFGYVRDLGLPICRDCRAAAWPDHAKNHLRKAHASLSAAERQAILADLDSWPGLCRTEGDFAALPTSIEDPLPGLVLHRDGKKCQLQSEQCWYVARSMGTLADHWRTAHRWSAGETRGGGRSAGRLRRVEERRRAAYQDVLCQRLFRLGRYCSYFEVRNRPPLLDNSDAIPAIDLRTTPRRTVGGGISCRTRGTCRAHCPIGRTGC